MGFSSMTTFIPSHTLSVVGLGVMVLPESMTAVWSVGTFVVASETT